MKKFIILLAAALVWTGCQKTEEANPAGEEQVVKTWNVSIRAEIPDTKAIAIPDGDDEATTTSLQTVWASSDHVFAYFGGEQIGQLSVTIDPNNNHLATLAGTLSTSQAILPGYTITLRNLNYRDNWTYDGQIGKLRFSDMDHIGQSISEGFNYTQADGVRITSVAEGSLVTESASFHNAQSIYRMSFRFQPAAGDKTPVSVKRLTVSSANNLIWRNSTDGYGPLDVVMTTATASPIFVAIRNDDVTNEEDLSFKVIGGDGATYFGSKTIPAQYKPNGTFVSMKNCTLTGRMSLPVSSAGQASTAL